MRARPANADARFLTATVAPDNAASQALFRGYARRHELPVAELAGYPASLFPADHAPEPLLRIGPHRRPAPLEVIS
ncbi:MAG: hypothetical protein R2939_17245 [Kofleriaceae bacterium]